MSATVWLIILTVVFFAGFWLGDWARCFALRDTWRRIGINDDAIKQRLKIHKWGPRPARWTNKISRAEKVSIALALTCLAIFISAGVWVVLFLIDTVERAP